MAEASPSVLIIRLDAIGDALALTPLIAALGRAGIPVDLVLSTANAQAFAPRAVRAVSVAPFALRSSERTTRAAIARFGADLSPNGYTHALVASEDLGAYRLAAAIATPVRVGFVNGWGKPLKTLWARRLLTHAILRSAGLDLRAPHECEVLYRLGVGLIGEAVPTREIARLRPLILENEPEPDARVAVQITDKWERLGIADDDVVELVRSLSERGLRAIAAARETPYADRIQERTAVTVERFETLVEWKRAIGAASALVAPDSGALHVAGMLGTPTVAVFPPSRGVALQSARWKPWAAPHRILEARPGWPSAVVPALASLERRV